MEVNRKVNDNFARMSDGRAFTSYYPNCLVNKVASKGEDSYKYRQTLIKHADEIIASMGKKAEERHGCNNCSKPIIPKERYTQECTDEACAIKEYSKDGIGIKQVN
tara:strand:+ start:257 stop:574 length:318 start_codon:yes stop_codon:yes gene_type:complete